MERISQIKRKENKARPRKLGSLVRVCHVIEIIHRLEEERENKTKPILR